MRSWNPRSTTRRLVVVMTGLALALTGCGSDDAAEADPAIVAEVDPETPTGPESPPAVSAPAETSAQPSAPAGAQDAETVSAQLVDFAIELGEDSFAAGTYEFTVTNAGDASHDFVVERDGEDIAATAVLQPGQNATLAVTFEPGRYVFYCSVGNHRAMGMEVSVEVA